MSIKYALAVWLAAGALSTAQALTLEQACRAQVRDFKPVLLEMSCTTGDCWSDPDDWVISVQERRADASTQELKSVTYALDDMIWLHPKSRKVLKDQPRKFPVRAIWIYSFRAGDELGDTGHLLSEDDESVFGVLNVNAACDEMPASVMQALENSLYPEPE